MKYSQWIGAFCIAALIAVCYMPWVHLPTLNIDVSGAETKGTNLGRPLTFFLVLGGIMFVMFLIPRVWAKRTNFFTGAFLMAYAIRCFIVYSLCDMGYCPERRAGLYLMTALSAIAFIMAFLPDMKVKNK